jgi:hypothetical protein
MQEAVSASCEDSTCQWSSNGWPECSMQEAVSASCDLWSRYDSSKIRADAMLATSKPKDIRTTSKREQRLRPAFQNYRRATEDKLLRAKLCKKVFGRWAAVSARCKPTLEDLLWTDDNMMHFLSTQVTFEAHVDFRRRGELERKNPDHPHHNKPMPIQLPPSLIKLWQLNLAAAHSEAYWENFGEMSVSRLTHTPFPLLLEHKGEEFTPTRLEACLWSPGAAASVEEGNPHNALVEELRNFSGSRLWSYLWHQAADHSRNQQQRCLIFYPIALRAIPPPWHCIVGRCSVATRF